MLQMCRCAASWVLLVHPGAGQTGLTLHLPHLSSFPLLILRLPICRQNGQTLESEFLSGPGRYLSCCGGCVSMLGGRGFEMPPCLLTFLKGLVRTLGLVAVECLG